GRRCRGRPASAGQASLASSWLSLRAARKVIRSHSRREMVLTYEGRTTGPPGKAVLATTWSNDDAEKDKLRSPIRERPGQGARLLHERHRPGEAMGRPAIR